AVFLIGAGKHSSFVNLAVGFSPTQTSLRSNFDHDWFFELPLTRERDAPSCGRRLYGPPCPVSSCPAYEPNSGSFLPKPINKSLMRSRGADIVMQSSGLWPSDDSQTRRCNVLTACTAPKIKI